jgi:hypothetical protein
MRNKWEDAARDNLKDELDAPAAISERQLRRLRRGARAGVLALLLALAATIASAWSLVMDSGSLSRIHGIQDVREKVFGAIGQTTPKEYPMAEASAPDRGGASADSAKPDSAQAGGASRP